MWISRVSSFWETLQQSRFSSAQLSAVTSPKNLSPCSGSSPGSRLCKHSTCASEQRKKQETTTAEKAKPHMEQKWALRNLKKSHPPKNSELFRDFFCFYFHFLTTSDLLLWTFMAGGLMHCSLPWRDSWLRSCSPCLSKALLVSRTFQGKFPPTARPGVLPAKPAPLGSSEETLYYIFHYTYLILACVHLVFVQ